MDIFIVLACGAVGYFVVAYGIEFSRRRKMATRSTGTDDGGCEKHGPDGRPREQARDNTNRQRPPAWYEVLGVRPSASADEVKKAYRERIREYHPDRVQGLGVELRELAERRAKEINAAFAEAGKR